MLIYHGKKQIDNVCKLCARNIGVLNKVKHFLPEQALYKLHCLLILPYLNYGLLLWGNANRTYLNIVCKLQKRALRGNGLFQIAHTYLRQNLYSKDTMR